VRGEKHSVSPPHLVTLSPCHLSSGPMHHPPPSRPENRPIIRVLQAIDVCFSRLYHRLNVRSPQQLPRDGAAILVSNHISGLDPLLIQSVCPRLIRWMMAKEYMEVFGLRWVFKRVGIIPVARSG